MTNLKVTCIKISCYFNISLVLGEVFPPILVFTHLSDHTRFQMDKSNLTGMVLLDLQKAFDTVAHGVLLIKLEVIGLNTDSSRWFQSYLSGRTQLVDVHGTCSSFDNVTCGVPQGSTLGPLLFLIHVNDMAGAINEKILLYADDTVILVSDKHVDATETRLGTALETISVWFIDNNCLYILI